MSIQERRAIVSMFSTVVITAVYISYRIQNYPSAAPFSAEVFRFWGSFFFALIMVSIVVKIGIAIVFSILNSLFSDEKEPTFKDERERLIELKAWRNSFFVFVGGFLLAMGAAVAEYPPSVMFGMLLFAGFAADITSDASTFIFNRRGV